jgi:hypothetical protein
MKGKVAPAHAMKEYSDSRRIAPHILNLGSEWRTPCSGHFIPGKQPRLALNMGLGKARAIFHSFEETNIFWLSIGWNPGAPSP